MAAAKEYIGPGAGARTTSVKKRVWKSRSATAAQDAHEAIRPSVPGLTPEEVEQNISGDTAKLRLIVWAVLWPDGRLRAGYDVRLGRGSTLFRASGYGHL